MSENPIITPAKFLSLFGVEPTDNTARVALLAFCPFHDLEKMFGARPVEMSLFTHVDRSHQYLARVGDLDVLMVENVYGGPVCATVIEEMAYLGVRYALGYGFSGSLRRELEPGSIVLATSGFVSDGTSREYTSLPEVDVSGKLLRAFHSVPHPLQSIVIRGKAWTTDAIYREYPSKVATWVRSGADFVNMDTSPFYAAASSVGMDAMYLSLVSDYVGEQEWNQQFTSLATSRARLYEILLTLISEAQL